MQGIYTILNGITNTWFNPNLTEIVKHIREGTLDFVLLTIDSQFYFLKNKPIRLLRNNTWIMPVILLRKN